MSVATEVRSAKSGRKQTMSIDYVLHENANAWRVFDLVTDGVGLVENYRSQFNKIIAKEGVTGLLDRMRKKKVASNPGELSSPIVIRGSPGTAEQFYGSSSSRNADTVKPKTAAREASTASVGFALRFSRRYHVIGSTPAASDAASIVIPRSSRSRRNSSRDEIGEPTKACGFTVMPRRRGSATRRAMPLSSASRRTDTGFDGARSAAHRPQPSRLSGSARNDTCVT